MFFYCHRCPESVRSTYSLRNAESCVVSRSNSNYSQLSPAETRLGRQISPTLYTVTEFNQRRANGNPFLKRVLEGTTILLKGDIDAT